MVVRVWATAVVALLALYAVTVTQEPLLGDAYAPLWRWESSTLYAAIALGGTWAAIRRPDYALLAAAVVSYAVGSLVIRITSDAPLRSFDDPAIGQVLLLLSYPLACAGMARLAGRDVVLLRRTLIVDGVAGILAITALASLVLLGRTDESAGDTGEIVALLLPASEAVLAVVALALVALTQGPGRRAWALIAAGFLLICVGNWSIAVGAADGRFVRDGLLSACTPAGNALIVLACMTTRGELSRVTRRLGIAVLVVPALCLVPALTVLVLNEVSDVRSAATQLALAAIAIILLRGAFTLVSLERVFESRRFEQGFEEARVGMALLSSTARWQRVNGALCAFLGAPPERLVGRPATETIHGEDVKAFARLVAGDADAFGAREPIVRFVRGDDRVVEALVTTTPVAGPAGSDEPSFLAQLQDVTERRRTERHKSAVSELVERLLGTTDTTAAATLAADLVRRTLDVEACAVLDGDRVVAASPQTTSGAGAAWSYTVPLGRRADSSDALAVRARVLAPGDEDLVRAVAGVLASAWERVNAEEELRHLGLHDPLTGLANRTLLHTLLDQLVEVAARRGTMVAVLLMDLDGFKTVNDTLGHAAGDELLRHVADRLRERVPEADVIARLGGDEFVVAFGGCPSDAAVGETTGRVLGSVQDAFAVGERDYRLTASVGVAVARDGHSRPPDLIRDADVAMYRAKERGGGRFEVFDTALRNELLHRVWVEDGLRRALDHDELRLHYQPIVDLSSGRAVGAEALLRWEHPERGLLGPGAFLPIAETSPLIVEIGRWALGEACRQVAEWSTMTGEVPRVSVNIAAAHVTPVLVDDVVTALDTAGIGPSQLGIELTESSLMDPDATVPVVRDLRRLGVHVALDDFGTGYSSLSYLERYALDAVKLDRTFLRDACTDRGRGLLRAAIDLARALDLYVVAEGIETGEQLELLRALECRLGQGFHIARPAPSAEAAELLVGRRTQLVAAARSPG